VKVLIFGATGMVGLGVLRECLAAEDVEQVVTVGRSPVEQAHPKLMQIVHRDVTDYSAVESQLSGFDACFFCLGVSSGGMSEDAYRRLTYDVTLAAAKVLARLNSALVFTYVSGAGTDSTESGRVMWARVKGKTENDLSKLPLAGVYLFRGDPSSARHPLEDGELPRLLCADEAFARAAARSHAQHDP
jgi:uncharacterized protein YbjT (DUF2867 family)